MNITITSISKEFKCKRNIPTHQLDTDPEKGLNQSEVVNRLIEHGYNEVPEPWVTHFFLF
jgi:magnesium-transporting ATPase (P-type)